MNVIVKLKHKSNELIYRNACFCIIRAFGINIEEIIVYPTENETRVLLVANIENVEYIYLYDVEENNAKEEN